MSIPNPVLSTIIFVFALQSIILSAMLYTKRPKTLPRVLLALLVFFFSLMALNIALVNVLITYDVFYVFRYVQLELLFGIGPTLYLYTRSITDSNFTFRRKDYLHFVPVILEFIFYRTSLYRLGAEGMYLTPVHPYTKIYLTEQWLGIISISLYTLIALRILYGYQNWLKERYSNIERKSLGWLKTPVIFFSCFWIGWTLLTEIDRFFFEGGLKQFYFLPTFIGLAVVTCWIGFKGYLQSQTDAPADTDKKDPDQLFAEDPQFKLRLTEVMEKHKLYLDPNLDLTTLAERLNMKPKLVSSLINQSFQMNFYELINRFRIGHFTSRLADPDSSKLTLIGLAFDCGFNSKSTFNHTFKKIVGKTPSQYARELKKESEWKQSVV